MLVIFIAIICPFFLFAQKPVDVKYEQDASGGYVFSCFNKTYSTYILEVGFSGFTNLRSDISLPYHAEVKPGFTKLFTIRPVNPQEPVNFKFSTANQKGCMHPVVDNQFTYLFPVRPSDSAQVYEMTPDKQTDSAAWYVLRLKMKAGDTIYAARKGIVNEVSDQHGENDAGQSSIGTENYIEISQSDCSFARYGILKKNGSLVKPGESVRAGQPIALVGGDRFNRGSEIRFSVYYYQEENDGKSASPHYVTLQVWTKKNGKGKLKHGVVYTSEFPSAVLNQENIALPAKKTVKKKKSS